MKDLSDLFTETVQPAIWKDGAITCAPSCPSFDEIGHDTKCRLNGSKNQEWHECKPFANIRTEAGQ